MMNPLVYARLAQEAYSVAPEIGDAGSASRAIVRTTEDGVCAVFRGSDNVASWAKDLDFATQPVPGMGNVHSGFMEALNENIGQLANLMPEVIAGHSLGGALAILLAAYLCLQGKPPKAVFAYEPPRVSTDPVIGQLLASHNVQVHLFRNGNDLVTQVPEELIRNWQHPDTLSAIGEAALLIENFIDHEISRVVAAVEALGII